MGGGMGGEWVGEWVGDSGWGRAGVDFLSASFFFEIRTRNVFF